MSTPNPPWDYPGPPQQRTQPQDYGYPNSATPKTNWWAVVSFALGLCGVVVISVVCGIVALSQAKRGGGGRGLAIAGLVLSGLWVLPLVAIIVYGVTSGLTTDRKIVAADEVEVGDCIAEIPQEARVETVATVDCQRPHAGEVYAQLTVRDRDFPGEDAIVDRYASKCEPELARYSPAAAKDMSIALVYLHPTEETWKRGDRAVHCIAMTLPPRSGSIKG